GALDQHFLSVLRPKIGTVGDSLGAHYRERNVVLYSGCSRVLEKVLCGSGEELHDRLLFERRRVRDVDENGRITQNLSKAFARQSVDARVWRGRHGVPTLRAQQFHQFRSDQPGSTDNDDLWLA